MRNKQFDLLRLIAAILVIVSHSFDLPGLRTSEPLHVITNGRFIFSDLGIYIFFIISGYLISQSCSNSYSAVNFAVKRILRILPALIVVVTITVLVVGPLLTTNLLHTYFQSRHTYLYFLNITLLQMHYELPGVFQENPFSFVNGSLWTLPYEALMYLIVAIQFNFSSKRKAKWFSIIVFALCFACYLANITQTIPVIRMSIDKFGLLGTLFASGMVVYHFELTKDIKMIPWLPVILVNIICLMFLPKLIFLFIAFPILVFSIANARETIVNQLTRFGDVSYGMYIYAFLVQQIVISQFKVTPLLLLVNSLIISWVLGYLSWKLVEQPALRWKDQRQVRA